MKHFSNSFKTKNYFKRHKFHIIVKNDSLPIFTSLMIGNLLLSLINYWHYDMNSFFIKINFFLLLLILFDWFFTINKEAVNGFHTKKVQMGILKGMVLFILSEIMFFFSIFWAFFHFKFNPSLTIGCLFPPMGINIIKMNCFPLLNTVFLVYSGLFLMNSLDYLKKGNYEYSFKNTFICIILGLAFILIQFIEYSDSTFSFNDSCYGSIFFLLTGFHGFHVIVGLIFLIICAFRLFIGWKVNKRPYKSLIAEHIICYFLLKWFFLFIKEKKHFSVIYSDDITSYVGALSKIQGYKTFSIFNNLFDSVIWVSIVYFYLKSFEKLSVVTFLNIKSNCFKSKSSFFSKFKGLNRIYLNSSNDLIKVDWYKINNSSNFFELELINYINYNKGLLYAELIEDSELGFIYCYSENDNNDVSWFLENLSAYMWEIKHIEYLAFKSYEDWTKLDLIRFKKYNSSIKMILLYHDYYNFIKKNYQLNLISNHSKNFYAWRSLLVWINFNKEFDKTSNFFNYDGVVKWFVVKLNAPLWNFNRTLNIFNFNVFFLRKVDTKFLANFLSLKRDSNIGFICASWYWHFVDAIWLVVVSVIYSDLLVQVCHISDKVSFLPNGNTMYI